jgi:hypothetical protein
MPQIIVSMDLAGHGEMALGISVYTAHVIVKEFPDPRLDNFANTDHNHNENIITSITRSFKVER